VFLNSWATYPVTATLPWPTVEFDPAEGSTTETDLPIPLAQLPGISEELDGRRKPLDDDGPRAATTKDVYDNLAVTFIPNAPRWSCRDAAEFELRGHCWRVEMAHAPRNVCGCRRDSNEFQHTCSSRDSNRCPRKAL
jgi:hypothetical protein